MEFQSPYASLGQLMFSPDQTAQASGQLQNKLGRQYNTMTALKAQPASSGIGRSLKGALVGQGQYDAAKKLAPIGQQFDDAAANARYSQQLQGANDQFGIGMLGRVTQNINQNNSPTIPLALANSQLNNFNNAQGWLGQLMSGW